MMTKIDAVPSSALYDESASSFKLYLPVAKAITSAKNAPMAPAAVGEKKPKKMPPMTIITSVGNGQIFQSAVRKS